MGGELDARDGRFPPLTVRGARLRAISYELPVASAQVKSCVLLAALAADGATTVGEPERSRDHTERMLLRAGVNIHRNGRHVTVVNADELILDRVCVPGDPSSAAFLVAAGVLVPGSRLLLRDVGVNWTRTGFLRIVRRMRGIVLGDLEPETGELVAEEPLSDLDIAHGALEATEVEAEEVPLAIDELPLVALLGCYAEGETIVRGAQELRVKESDRIAGVVEGLRGLGADIEATDDGFAVRGIGRPARRRDRRAWRPPHGDDGRRRRARLARGSRGRRDRGGRGVLPGVRGGSRASLCSSAIRRSPPARASPQSPARSRMSLASPTWTAVRCIAAWRCSRCAPRKRSPRRSRVGHGSSSALPGARRARMPTR